MAEAPVRRLEDSMVRATADMAYHAERMERIARRVARLRAGTVALSMAGGSVEGAVTARFLKWNG